MSNANKGAEYLIALAKSASNGTTLHLHALKALGDAGGLEVQEYLVSVAKAASNGTTLHLAAVEALGRASRDYCA